MFGRTSLSLETSLLDELTARAKELGKKKTQIVREALEDYFDALDADREMKNIKSGEYDGQMINHATMRQIINAA
ncbi:hypothetical protein FACS1894103_5450 [Campylobacterota bacterium]|nr:hypothetical protein FACS1894103_5450 [Campylobacterota bacterium]